MIELCGPLQTSPPNELLQTQIAATQVSSELTSRLEEMARNVELLNRRNQELEGKLMSQSERLRDDTLDRLNRVDTRVMATPPQPSSAQASVPSSAKPVVLSEIRPARPAPTLAAPRPKLDTSSIENKLDGMANQIVHETKALRSTVDERIERLENSVQSKFNDLSSRIHDTPTPIIIEAPKQTNPIAEPLSASQDPNLYKNWMLERSRVHQLQSLREKTIRQYEKNGLPIK